MGYLVAQQTLVAAIEPSWHKAERKRRSASRRFLHHCQQSVDLQRTLPASTVAGIGRAVARLQAHHGSQPPKGVLSFLDPTIAMATWKCRYCENINQRPGDFCLNRRCQAPAPVVQSQVKGAGRGKRNRSALTFSQRYWRNRRALTFTWYQNQR